MALRLGDQLAASHPRSITAEPSFAMRVRRPRGGNHADALARAQRYTGAFPDDLEGWRLLGRAAEAQGRPVLASLAAAEAYALLGAWRLRWTSSSGVAKQKDSDFLLLSRMDARLATFRTELMNEKPPSSSRWQDSTLGMPFHGPGEHPRLNVGPI